ncbi:hypothetical protein J422_02924 [Methanocaldococcus villosus KIN24-T80]|uniref:UPF0280 protein J422_02924 n=1 Tax=Methanocaldococcus villosus KIN24-T80 TaxID=1069083 RepID=N6VT69_9EURY|nr:UPF0280 family protein [Methanocaldococcus villosus]ENN96391.1 hypothetical protein J422_02924 [Methanocaldococcus villosus KIN24-T80]
MISRRIIFKETNMLIKTENYLNIKLAEFIIRKCRFELENYIKTHPEFLYSLEPIDVEGKGIIKLMSIAGKIANVGPMASVAGAIAEMVVKNTFGDIIADNGGDICLRARRDINVGLYSGLSKLSGEIGFKLKKEMIKNIYGIATSSATVGHSISFGNADSVTVFAKSSAIADAAATAICNATVGKDKEEQINNALERADDIERIDGVFIVIKDLVGVKGKIPELIKTNKKVTLGELFEIY